MTVDTTAAYTGVLAGAGKDAVRLVIHEHPIPSEPPPHFISTAAAVIGQGGEVVDWRYHPAADSSPEERARFRTWRATFAAERIVGDLATVRAFLDWASSRADVSKLQFLRHPETRLTINAMSRAAWQLQVVARLDELRREVGLGLFESTHKAPVRGFVTGDGPVNVLTDGSASVTATGAGLSLHQRSGPDLTLLGWRRAPSGVTALTPAGEEPVPSGAGAALLTMIAPAATEVRVAAVPLRTMFAELIVHLPEAARLAADCHAQLYCLTGQVKQRLPAPPAG